MSKADFERGKLKGVNDYNRFKKWLVNLIPWRYVIWAGLLILGYLAGMDAASGVCP